jgi:hypothetical protein
MAATLWVSCAMLADISATTAARDSRVKGTAADDPTVASTGAARAADKGLFVVGGVGGAVVGGMVGAAVVVVEAMIGKAADTRLIGFLVLPAISRKRYG